MVRRSPRLIANGYYHPNERLFYREYPMRTPRRRNFRLRSVSESNIDDYQRLERSRQPLRCEFVRPPTEGPRTEPPQQEAEEPLAAIIGEPLMLSFFIHIIYVLVLFLFFFTFVNSGRNMQEKKHENVYSLVQVIKEQMLMQEELEQIIYRALRTDNTGMADYALESLGSTVISSSHTYRPRHCSQFDSSIWCKKYGPETVLQPEVFPGKCWGFKGSKGHLVIALPRPVPITHVTMEHLPKLFSPTDHFKSAPKDFAVYGIVNNRKEERKERKCLGKFSYDQNGEPIQTFEVQDSPSEMYRLVALKVLNNWSDPEYTCVYRFRVHSQPRST